MPLTARLFLKGHEKEDTGIRILSCDFSFSQETEDNGLVSSSVKAGLINLSLGAINDTELVQWMFNRVDFKSGKISFIGPNDAGIQQEQKALEFEDGLLINYSESFTDESEIVTNMSISARKIKLSNAQWETQWDFWKENY